MGQSFILSARFILRKVVRRDDATFLKPFAHFAPHIGRTESAVRKDTLNPMPEIGRSVEWPKLVGRLHIRTYSERHNAR